MKSPKYNKNQRLADLKELAISRGGLCLSESFDDSQGKLIWQCSLGHIWPATQYNIKKGKWCPNCNNSLGERICNAYFEAIFDKKFIQTRPKWLKNVLTGGVLELDGYCEELGIAFEHQGEQHYSKIDHFQKNNEELNNRIELDKLKRKLCKENNVILIEIPQIGKLTKLDNLEQFIFNELQRNNIEVFYVNKIQIDWKKIYTSEDAELLEKLKKVAESRGGKLLSTVYLGANHKYDWECSSGHGWKASGTSISIRGSWCGKCAGKVKLTIEEMHELAKSRGGKCLSKVFIDSKSKLVWECNKGDIWESSCDNIKAGKTWCPYCAGVVKLTIEEMQEIAISREGKCLSTNYINCETKLKWECKKGHRWDATGNSVKRGSWCLECSGRAVGSIEEMQEIAKSRGGKCLSTAYVNQRSMLKWECKNGHGWEASAGNVKHKSWCPVGKGKC